MRQRHPARKPGAAQALTFEQALEYLLGPGVIAIPGKQARSLLEDALLARRRVGDADIAGF
jgi:hypothetical protein